MANENLSLAKKAKQDEFYTQWVDIEREMNAYLEYDPDVFRDQTILLPCDDPEWSNFTKYFALHFTDFGLKKLISTSYAPQSNNYGEYYQPTLFEINSPHYDEDKSFRQGRIFVLERKDMSGDSKINIEDLQWEYLNGDGDFRSDEVTKLRDEADMIITNGPFSLFRALLAWIIEGEKIFSVIGNVNAITYKEVFPLLMNNHIWLGPSITSGDREFRIPDSYPLNAAGQRIVDGKKYIRVKGVRWFTNIDHGRRHEPLSLMSMDDNLKYHPRDKVREVAYQKYDNYDAIEVPFTDAIPSDYEGIMGVPLTFLDKYNPDQFEILGMCENMDLYGLKTRTYTTQECKERYYELFGKPGTYDLNASGVINGKKVYQRILIRHRPQASVISAPAK